MPASPTSSMSANHLYQLQFARGATERIISDIPEDQLCAQPGSGLNHAMFVVGHLACTDDFLLKEFGGQPFALPESFHKAFGADPTNDATKYPPFAEVKKAFDERRQAVIKWFEGMSDAQLDAPTPEKWRAYAPTMRDVAFFAAWHEGYHGGQVSTLRRAFGLGPALG